MFKIHDTAEKKMFVSWKRVFSIRTKKQLYVSTASHPVRAVKWMSQYEPAVWEKAIYVLYDA